MWDRLLVSLSVSSEPVDNVSGTFQKCLTHLKTQKSA